MLVVCPCGKKLNVAETLAGKKVRCPVCKDVFLVQPDDSDKKGNVSIPKEQTKRRLEDSLPEKQRQPLSTKQQKRRPVEDDEDLLEEYEEEQPRSVRNKGRRVSAATSSVGLWRNIISTVILGALLIVLGFVVWTKFWGPGTVVLNLNVAGGVTVFVDGKEIEPSKEAASKGTITLTLSAGEHDIKIIKDGYEPDLRHFTIEAGSSGHYDVILRAAERPR